MSKNLEQEQALESLREALRNITPEEIAKYFPPDTKPKGWLSIEEYLPAWLGKDFGQGYSEYRVQYQDGTEGVTQVGDHNIWYYYAKEDGITHWWNN